MGLGSGEQYRRLSESRDFKLLTVSCCSQIRLPMLYAESEKSRLAFGDGPLKEHRNGLNTEGVKP